MDHLNQDQIRGYGKRTLPPDDLLAVDRHIKHCEECRTRLLSMASPVQMATLLGQTGSPHLSFEDLAAYADGTLPAADRSRVITHLELCGSCRAEADDLSGFRRDLNARQPRSGPQLRSSGRWVMPAAGIAAALAIGIGIATLSKHPPVRDEYADLTDRAVAAARVDIPPGIAALRSQRAVLRGQSKPGFQLLSPQATAVLSGQPEFSWEPAGVSASYVVEIYDTNQQPVEQSGPLAGNHWTPSRPLAPGQAYEWQVRATVGDTVLLAPGAEGPPARFLVMDAAASEKLATIARSHSDNHLLMGVLYAQSGALDRAEGELTAAGERGAGLLTYVRSLRK